MYTDFSGEKKAADAQVQDLVVPDRGPARLAEVRLRPQLPRHPPVRRLECSRQNRQETP